MSTAYPSNDSTPTSGATRPADTDYTHTTTPVRTVETTPARTDHDDLRYRLQHARMVNRPSTDIGLLLLRLGCVMLFLHGLSKATHYAGFLGALRNNAFGSLAPDLFGFLVVAGQLLLPIALLVGLFTRLSGLLLAVMMGFIAFVFTLPASGWINAQTGGLSMESSLLFLIPGLALFFTGAGRFSLDHLLGAKRRERKAERAAAI